MKCIKLIFLIIIIPLLSGCYLVRKQTDYYGVNIEDSKRIIFLIDISGSMEGKVEKDAAGNIVASVTSAAGNKLAKQVGGIGGSIIKKQTGKQLTKLGRAKREIIPTIRGFNDDVYFNIMTFENKVEPWRADMVKATAGNINLAIAFLNNLKSGGGTNISDALEEAFRFAGNAEEEISELGVETIFLLSDGAPTVGKITNRQRIISQVEEWNPHDRVVINTIGLGQDKDAEFLTKLAESNRGTYIDK
ncbi:MAG: VWA domain-containing protein [Bacteroidales bacterium]